LRYNRRLLIFHDFWRKVMPIYAYRCEDCGHAQDFLQKISDPLIDTCPTCSSKNFRKQVTAAGFQLKGGGWYVTDFRDSGKKDVKKAADGAADTKSGEAAATTESKLDGKSAEPASTSAPATPATSPAPSSGGDTKAA
jgi:putative FmdB family regulatory protein